MTTTLKDIRFGVELEFANISTRRASEVLASMINGRNDAHWNGHARITEHDPETGRPYPHHLGQCWQVVSDASVSGGAEVVTPPLRYDEIEKLQEVVRAMRRAGAKAASNAGIHIHVSHPDLDFKSIRNMVNWLYRQSDHVQLMTRTEERRRGQWCKPVEKKHVDAFRKAARKRNVSDIMQEAARAWYGAHNWSGSFSQHETRQRYHSSRYHAINLHSWFYRGTIEFRMFNSTTHAGVVKSYVQFVTALTAYAINQKNTSATKREIEGSPRYAARCVLLRLGLKGKEFKTCRLHMTKHLPGPSDSKEWPEGPAVRTYNDRFGIYLNPTPARRRAAAEAAAANTITTTGIATYTMTSNATGTR